VEQERDVVLLAPLLSASSFSLARVAIPAARRGLMNESEIVNALQDLLGHSLRDRSSMHMPGAGFASLQPFVKWCPQ